MVSNYEDLTIPFNQNGKVQIDISGWDYILAQIVTPSGAISFASTIDGGGVTGVSDGNATSALNFVACQGTNQLNNTLETSTSAANSVHEFDVVGRYLQLSGGAGSTVGKLLIMFTKIQ